MSTATKLSSIIQAIKDELSYDPKASGYYNSLQRRIQRVYEEILDSEPWLFAQKTADTVVPATVTASDTRKVTVTVATNPRLVVAVSPYSFSADMIGATFVDESGAEHLIVEVDTTIVPNEMYLGSKVASDISSANDQTWSIKFERLLLPADCKEVMGIMDRATDGIGRIVYVSRRQEEEAWLDADFTGHPQFYIEDDMLTVQAPVEAPVVSATTGGSLPARTFEYCYTISYAGRESAPSPVATVTTTGVNNRVQVTSLEDVRYNDDGTLRNSGIRRNIYRRDKTNDGQWHRITTVKSSVIASPYFNDDVLLPAYAQDREGLVPLNIPPVYQTIRAWETANTTRTWTLRYRYEPPPLVADSSVAILPRPYHNLLVYRVMADILTGGDATKYERRYIELLQKCRDSYLDRTDARYPTQSWMRERLGADYRRWDNRNLNNPTLS